MPPLRILRSYLGQYADEFAVSSGQKVRPDYVRGRIETYISSGWGWRFKSLRIASGVVLSTSRRFSFSAAAICGKFFPCRCRTAAPRAKLSFRGAPGFPLGTRNWSKTRASCLSLLRYSRHLLGICCRIRSYSSVRFRTSSGFLHHSEISACDSEGNPCCNVRCIHAGKGARNASSSLSGFPDNCFPQKVFRR